MDEQTDLPSGIGKPATRATEAELASLHGVGPKALRIIREALETRGQTFKLTD